MATRERGPTPDEIIQEQVDNIDEAIETLNKRLEKYDKIKAKRDQLVAARRALLGGSRLTGSGNGRLRQEDVVEFLKEHPGSGPTEIAEGVHSNYTTVASHLYRGKNERFLNKDGKWYVRDPKNGINTEEDIEDED